MLHDIILSLLGFTGDVVICEGNSFKVRPGFDKLSPSEQVGAIVHQFIFRCIIITNCIFLNIHVYRLKPI